MKQVKKINDRYFSPVHKTWRKIGDSLLIVSTSIAGYAVLAEIKWLAMAGLITGVLGKIITNFVKED